MFAGNKADFQIIVLTDLEPFILVLQDAWQYSFQTMQYSANGFLHMHSMTQPDSVLLPSHANSVTAQLAVV